MEKCDDEKLKADNNNMNLNLNLGRPSFEKAFAVTHIVQSRAILNQEHPAANFKSLMTEFSSRVHISKHLYTTHSIEKSRIYPTKGHLGIFALLKESRPLTCKLELLYTASQTMSAHWL